MKWYESPRCETSPVIAGQICIVRNVDGYPFEDKMTDAQREELLTRVRSVIEEMSEVLQLQFRFYLLREMDDYEVKALVGRLAVPPLMMGEHSCTGLMVSEDDSISILINGKEHICIQISCAGHAIREAFVLTNRVDDLINSKLRYAFSDKYGYLTASPLLTGTGMTASYLLHLPMLDEGQKIHAFEKELAQYGFILGGHFHGSSQAPGHIYRVRNRKTLGLSETEIISALEHLTQQIRRQEEQLASEQMAGAFDASGDAVYRAYGLLKFAWRLDYDEAMTGLSVLRAGKTCGIIEDDTLPLTFAALIGIDENVLKAGTIADADDEEICRLRAVALHRRLGEVIPPDTDETI